MTKHFIGWGGKGAEGPLASYLITMIIEVIVIIIIIISLFIVGGEIVNIHK